MAMEESSDKPSMLESDDISVIKQVALTVPITDDPTLPVITFRMWVLGTISCVMLSFVNQFFWYREQPISIDSTAAMIAAVPLGHLMAKTITKRVFFQGTPWSFTLNPGPFNVKEHVLIVIFANSGAGSVYAMHIVSAVKLFYKRNLTFFVSLILIMTTQVLGFGIAGIFRRYLVDPAEMWWPSNLVDVSLYGALHDKRKSRSKGGMTRTQFFMIALICSFAYYVLPGYLFPMLTSLSWVCWVFPKSVLAHQLGSGMKGLGLGSVSLDWATVVSYLGSPFVSPWFATANIAVGYGLLMYVVTPIAYWFDIYKAKTFPFYSSKLFMYSGRKYDISKIVNSNFNIDLKAYAQQGQLHLSSLFALSYGFGFAALPATLVHTAIFHGREIMELSRSSFGRKKMDVHTRLMQKYKQVPQWWFIAILVVNLAIVILTCVFFKDQVQLPWWGVLLAFSISIIYTLPIGILSATANSAPGLNIITEYVLGYLYPGRPVANMCFKVYGYISMTQALTFLGDLKIGHYMKIPPRSMFMAQVVGTIISSFVYLLTGWMLMSSIPNLCDTSALPADSPWTCPLDTVFYDASIIWGLIGPRRIFGDLGVYGSINWFFLLGAVSPIIVWLVQKVFPKQKWISLINIPVIFSATGIIPPASSLNYNAWIVLAFISGFVVFRYKQNLWKRYNYILSGGLDAGVAFMSVLLFFTLSSTSIQWWGNDSDGCPLATCPTAKGVIVDGCPIV